MPYRNGPPGSGPKSMALPAGASALRDITAPPVNFGATAQDYGRYRVGFPQSFFKRLFAEGWVNAGDRVLDLGTGTGTIARGLALRGCQATGLDSEQHLLTEAARLDREAATGVSYVEGRAEATGLPAAKLRRRHRRPVLALVRPQTDGGRGRPHPRAGRAPRDRAFRLAGDARQRRRDDRAPWSSATIRAWHLGNASGLYPPWLADVAEGGFERLETFSFDTEVTYSHEAWRGRMRASAGVGASLPPRRGRALRRRAGGRSWRAAGRTRLCGCRTASGRSRPSGRADRVAAIVTRGAKIG